jgi:hypothetical protein
MDRVTVEFWAQFAKKEVSGGRNFFQVAIRLYILRGGVRVYT